MLFFDRKSTFILLLCTLPLLFIPKFNLISLSSETAGIRLDDLLLLFLALIISWAYFGKRHSLTPIEKCLLWITFFSLAAVFINRLSNSLEWTLPRARLPYSVRLLEYFLFFYVGGMLVRFSHCSHVLKALFNWNLSVMILQKIGLIGGFVSGIYIANISWRVIGVSSFPAEMGLVLNLFYCYFAFSNPKPSFFISLFPKHWHPTLYALRTYWLFLIFGILTLLTGSRIALIGLGVCFLCKLYQEVRSSSHQQVIPILCVAMVLLGLTAFSLTKVNAVFERSKLLFKKENIELAERVWSYVSTDEFPEEDPTVLDEERVDTSWWIRVHRWCFALKVYILNPQCWLWGVGPGFATVSLDGGWLRILTENGLIGLCLYLRLFRLIAKQNRQLFWMIFIFSINMVFFDAYLAYKPMSMLFLFSGYTSALSYAKYHQSKQVPQSILTT